MNIHSIEQWLAFAFPPLSSRPRAPAKSADDRDVRRAGGVSPLCIRKRPHLITAGREQTRRVSCPRPALSTRQNLHHAELPTQQFHQLLRLADDGLRIFRGDDRRELRSKVRLRRPDASERDAVLSQLLKRRHGADAGRESWCAQRPTGY